METEIGKKYILKHGFFDDERVGEEVEVIVCLDEYKQTYLAIRDKRGVSIPFKRYYVE